jgi:hypothetical protein
MQSIFEPVGRIRGTAVDDAARYQLAGVFFSAMYVFLIVRTEICGDKKLSPVGKIYGMVVFSPAISP